MDYKFKNDSQIIFSGWPSQEWIGRDVRFFQIGARRGMKFFYLKKQMAARLLNSKGNILLAMCEPNKHIAEDVLDFFLKIPLPVRYKNVFDRDGDFIGYKFEWVE